MRPAHVENGTHVHIVSGIFSNTSFPPAVATQMTLKLTVKHVVLDVSSLSVKVVHNIVTEMEPCASVGFFNTL